MIDIHIHMVPGVDDGSQDIETSLEMAAMAADSGVSHIITTPHCNIPNMYENYVSDRLERRWNELHDAVREVGIPVHLYKGMEIYATPELPDLLAEKKVWTLNGTKYFLMEFGFDEDPDFTMWVLPECIKLGYTPIVAHPERYFFIQRDPQIAYEWYRMGCGLQVNKGSLLMQFGPNEKETGDSLLRHGIVSCVGSDAHGTRRRTSRMDELNRYLTETYGGEYAFMLMEENPRRILKGRRMVGYEPIPYYVQEME